VIAELEPSLFQAPVEQARASIVRLQADARRASVQSEDAQHKLKRARELSQQQLIPAAELETAQATAREAETVVEAAAAQIVQARASLHQAEVNLAHTIITAPIDGTVISRNVDVGQTVAASMQAPTLFVIARDLTKMQVNARVAESDIGRIETGQPVTFRVDAYPGLTFSGTVSLVRLDPLVEQSVVSYITAIDVPNPQLRLKPGMTANVTVEIERASHVLRVPIAATRVSAGDDNDFMVRSLEMASVLTSTTRTMTWLLAAVAAVSLLVGGIGIMNIMLVSVTERTKEIGLRLSVGASDVDVLLQFIVEAIVLSVAGGAVGIVAGVAASYTVGEVMQWPLAVTTRAVLLAFGFAVFVGVFFGFYPARKAARLNPIEALRYE